MAQEIVTIEQSSTPLILNRNPSDVLNDAKTAALALTTVISQKKKPVMMNGEQYLEFEDWQTVGQFYGYMVSTGEAEPVEIEGVKGAKASAKLVNFHNGEVLGGAESYCMRDEPNWKTKPWFQLASMAQTRAGAKALRNRLAWVVVLAGYRATPAEEIQDMVRQEPPAVAPQPTAEHWCKEHNIAFFMRGKMKSYAHPIGETGEWCHEHKTKPVDDAPDPAWQEIVDGKNSETAPEKPQEAKPAPKAAPAKESIKAEPKAATTDPASIKTLGDLFNACLKDFKLSKPAALKELGYASQGDISDSPADCYLKIKASREG